MVEHTHHRYRSVEKLKEMFAALQASMREKDERSLEPFLFLQETGEDIQEQTDAAFKRMKRLLFACMAAGTLLFLLIAVTGRSSGDLHALLVRPEPDGSKTEADVLLVLRYGDEMVKEPVTLEIPPRDWSRREAEALFDRCEEELRNDTFHGGRDLDPLRGDLNLPTLSADGLVTITWSSSDPARVSGEGEVDLIGAEPGETVTLTAVLSMGDHARRVDFEAVLPSADGMDWKDSLRRESASLVQGLPETLTDTEQILPEKSRFGADARWTLQKEPLPWEVAGLCLFVCVVILFSRTDALKRCLKRKQKAFEQEIPNMAMQMILLLDAGLTVETAFTRLVAENAGQENPLYRSFSHLEAESKATNMPFVNLLYVYARQSGSRDLIRFASLALDCSGRGSELAEKLDRERQQLWNARMNAAKARAREAETKLCLPLMVLLLVMVVIAISPALLGL